MDTFENFLSVSFKVNLCLPFIKMPDSVVWKGEDGVGVGGEAEVLDQTNGMQIVCTFDHHCTCVHKLPASLKPLQITPSI